MPSTSDSTTGGDGESSCGGSSSGWFGSSSGTGNSSDPGNCGVEPGQVSFDNNSIIQSNASADSEALIREAVRTARSAYLERDEDTLASVLMEDATLTALSQTAKPRRLRPWLRQGLRNDAQAQ